MAPCSSDVMIGDAGRRCGQPKGDGEAAFVSHHDEACSADELHYPDHGGARSYTDIHGHMIENEWNPHFMNECLSNSQVSLERSTAYVKSEVSMGHWHLLSLASACQRTQAVAEPQPASWARSGESSNFADIEEGAYGLTIAQQILPPKLGGTPFSMPCPPAFRLACMQHLATAFAWPSVSISSASRVDSKSLPITSFAGAQTLECTDPLLCSRARATATCSAASTGRVHAWLSCRTCGVLSISLLSASAIASGVVVAMDMKHTFRSLVSIGLPVCTLRHVLLTDTRVLNRVVRCFEPWWLIGNLVCALVVTQAFSKSHLARWAVWSGLLSGISCVLNDAIRVPQLQKLHTQATHAALLWTCVVVSATQTSDATDHLARVAGLRAANVFFGRILTLAIYYTRYAFGILQYVRKHDHTQGQMCMMLSRPLLRRDRATLLGDTLTLHS